MTTRQLFPPTSGTPGGETFAEGEVERLTFENTDTGFRVVKLAVAGTAERLTVVGTLPPVHEGARLRVRGRMVTDPRHGPQLRAESATLLAPNTSKGVLRYLASGVVPGIGEKLAARIVETFGDATMRVLEEEPARLAAVPGLGKKRAERLSAAWSEGKTERDVLVFLQSHGATASLAARVAKRYGANAIQVVRKDPYRLALDVTGVGFKTADRIAHGLGIARDSPQRLEAGLLQALLDETETGHVYAPHSALFDRATHLLGDDQEESPVTTELLDAAFDGLARAGHVVVERTAEGSIAYLPRMFVAERRLATRACELSAAKVPALDGAENAIARFEKESGVLLADEQRTAVTLAAQRPLLILTGGPGVGKTTVLKAVLSLFRQSGLSVRLAAPTGRAAKRMTAATSIDASTLHRLLEFDPQRGGTFKRDARLPIDAQAIIVDEASMIDLPLADALFQAIADGTRVVFVGDKDQLPSIGPGAVLRDLIRSEVAPCVTLRRIFRQAHESQIVVNAHRIHDGEPPVTAAPNDPNGDFFIIHPRDAESATATITELVSSRIPRKFGMDPFRDIQVLTPMHRGAAGSVAINLALQAALNPKGASLTRGQREFRVGDKVMQLKNDYDRSIWNGDIGIVSRVDPSRGALSVMFDDERIVAYEPGALDSLTLAYACSVHKAQGSEFPAVVIPLLTQHFVMLSMNLLYTAVTRGKRLVVLVADPRAIRLALSDSRKDERHSRLAARIAALSESGSRHPAIDGSGRPVHVEDA